MKTFSTTPRQVAYMVRVCSLVLTRILTSATDCIEQNGKTINSRYSLVVTDPTTNLSLIGLSTGDRTGTPVFRKVWSIAEEKCFHVVYNSLTIPLYANPQYQARMEPVSSHIHGHVMHSARFEARKLLQHFTLFCTWAARQNLSLILFYCFYAVKFYTLCFLMKSTTAGSTSPGFDALKKC